MNVIRLLKNQFKKRILSVVREEVQKAMIPLLRQVTEFHSCRNEERQSYHDHTKDPFGNLGYYASLKDRLVANNIPVYEIEIGISDFEHWLDNIPEIREHYRSAGDMFIEKCLEHYLSCRYLSVSEGDVLIDMAADHSPFADILNGKGIKSYKLDLRYGKGIHGIRIGADAVDTKLPDMFASALSLHCAYECFAGDADVRFLKEARRILNAKGRYAILPLYLEDTYFIATSPYCNQADIAIDSGAKRVWRDDEYQAPFARFYSPESFKERIYSQLPPDMKATVYYFKNLGELMKNYPGQRIYCFFMFHCQK